jgi:exosome complex RNA-binding protein Rrp42 (RNase PH superfamily)
MEERYASILSDIFLKSGAIDLQSLCIIQSKYCWFLHIDVLVLLCDGIPIDAASIAIYAALKSTKIPKIDLIMCESGKYEDFDVIGDIADAAYVQLHDVPLSITAVKIGNKFIYDCNLQEYQCAETAIVVAIDRLNNCCGIHKLYTGHISIDEIMQAFDVSCIVVC